MGPPVRRFLGLPGLPIPTPDSSQVPDRNSIGPDVVNFAMDAGLHHLDLVLCSVAVLVVVGLEVGMAVVPLVVHEGSLLSNDQVLHN